VGQEGRADDVLAQQGPQAVIDAHGGEAVARAMLAHDGDGQGDGARIGQSEVQQALDDGAGGGAGDAQVLYAGGMLSQPGAAPGGEALKLHRAAGAAAEGIVHGRIGAEEGREAGEVAETFPTGL